MHSGGFVACTQDVDIPAVHDVAGAHARSGQVLADLVIGERIIPVGPGCWILGNGLEVVNSCRESSESCVPGHATALPVGGSSEGVSKEHLFMEITARRGRQDILVKDLGSRNGTYIMSADGWRTKMEKLTTLVLRDGDSLILGRLEVRGGRLNRK